MMKRKKIAACLMAAAMTMIPAMTSFAGQWMDVNGSYWYKNDDGTAYTGWLKDNEYWYFLDRQTCYMRTGWVQDNGKWYYCYDNGIMHPSGWLDLGSKRYYMYEDGSMASGVFQVSSYRYQTDTDGSIIRSKIKDGIRYDEEGCMMVRDEDRDWVYLQSNDDIQQQAEDRLRERYMDHDFASHRAFENAVREAFTGIWSEAEILDFLEFMEAEFFDTYDCSYDSYRE